MEQHPISFLDIDLVLVYQGAFCAHLTPKICQGYQNLTPFQDKISHLNDGLDTPIYSKDFGCVSIHCKIYKSI